MLIINLVLKNLWPLTNIRELWTSRCIRQSRGSLTVRKWKLTCFNLASNLLCPQNIGSAALGCEFRHGSHRDHADNTSVRHLVLRFRHRDRMPSLDILSWQFQFTLHWSRIFELTSAHHDFPKNPLIFATVFSNDVPDPLYNHKLILKWQANDQLCDCVMVPDWSESEGYKDTRWSERVQVMVGNGKPSA